ncbi:hypothetical protein ACQ4M4_09245 [Leptolyngbya sp. AN02str]|uniref:hypothetical protein n=1 Tax=Leptolyngbya sp. AN02str TaxID=3423363 RepID=UPI003D3232CF
MQDRFYALLKRKLRTEIESNPPLFPWESEMLEYEAEPTALQIWLQQLRSLNLPTTLPESVLERLLGQCQVMMQSSLREGAKLVKVVETLFPNQDQTLNDLAGWVLTAPARSPNATLPNMQDVGFPSEYDAATETQKMALSLMAAREILDALTFKLSATQPQITREWQTGAGPLCLTAEKVSAGTVMVKVALPCAGTVVFLGNDGKESIYQQTTAGDAVVTQVDLEVGQSYPLNVQLAQTDEPGLTFAIQLIGAA